MSANAALKALGTIKLVECETEEGTKQRIVTRAFRAGGQDLEDAKDHAPCSASSMPPASHGDSRLG